MEPSAPTAERPPRPDAGVAPRAVTGERIRLGLRKRGNWLQLVKFGTVGASGFFVNFLVYWFLLRQVGIHYMLAAFGAFCVAVSNNFAWNRLWTFRDRRHADHPAFQAARFLTVATIALAINLTLLRLFVEVFELPKIEGQLLAVCLVTPVSFLGNKLWSFR